MIGDPSMKSQERNLLDEETLQHNIAGIKKQLSRILDFDSDAPNKAELVNNYDWMKNYSFLNFIRDVGKHITVNYMMAKDSVKKRLSSESREGMSFTEFSYQILQGNDFLHLYDAYGCTMEVGGADQWGNITAGTDLVRKMRGRSVYGLTFPLLLDGTGKKFGKSEGNAMFMSAEKTSVYDWYQFFLRSADEDVIRYLKVFSLRPLDEIAELERQMKANPEARIPQKALAEELTALVHGAAGLETARGATQALFGGDVAGKGADELETIFRDVKSAECARADVVGKPVWAVAAQAGMFKSNGEARRMAQQGGLSLNGAKADAARVFAEGDLVEGRVAVLRSGKKNFFLLRVR